MDSPGADRHAGVRGEVQDERGAQAHELDEAQRDSRIAHVQAVRQVVLQDSVGSREFWPGKFCFDPHCVRCIIMNDIYYLTKMLYGILC